MRRWLLCLGKTQRRLGHRWWVRLVDTSLRHRIATSKSILQQSDDTLADWLSRKLPHPSLWYVILLWIELRSVVVILILWWGIVKWYVGDCRWVVLLQGSELISMLWKVADKRVGWWLVLPEVCAVVGILLGA
eukprot:TRINITY_DN1151_c0_g2_i1.p2 TRINITY_DN1151_c0_g2~~TRINITY_DN1151_c0_g2_i1.p2  ORF type:complete len:133 (-),score=7.01 TRINITY_DN1151_c0_g2_i1:473-871(-)